MLRILGHKCRLTGSQRSAGAENYHVILLSLPGGVPESSQVQRDMMGSDAQRPGHSRSSTWRSCLWFTQSSYHLCVALLEVVSVRDNDQGCPDERVPDHPTSCVPCSVLCFTKGPIHAVLAPPSPSCPRVIPPFQYSSVLVLTILLLFLRRSCNISTKLFLKQEIQSQKSLTAMQEPPHFFTTLWLTHVIILMM